jgi:hypothetical protein
MLSRSVEGVNRSRSATLLRWARRTFCARARSLSHISTSDGSALGGWLLVLRGGTGEGEAHQEKATKLLFFSLGGLFFGHGGLGSEKQL